MAGYNPTAQAPTKPQNEYDDREIPSGVYLFGPAWLQCPSPLSWKIRAEVLMGNFVGASAFVLQGRDTSKQGTRNRLYYFAQSAGLEGVELDANEHGIITEASLRQDVLGHAFKAKIVRKTNRRQDRSGNWRDFVDYDFQSFHPRSEWAKAELDIALKWETAYAEKRAAEGNGDGGWHGAGSSSSSQEDPGTNPEDPGGWGEDGWD